MSGRLLLSEVRKIDVLIFDDYFKTIINYLLTTGLGAIVCWLTMKVREHKKKSSRMETILIENSLLTGKAIIYSDNPRISLNERLKAFKVYRSLGGNGETYMYVKNELLQGADPDEYLKMMEKEK